MYTEFSEYIKRVFGVFEESQRSKNVNFSLVKFQKTVINERIEQKWIDYFPSFPRESREFLEFLK